MRLVLVEWVDSFGSTDGGWQTIKENLNPQVPICRSVGWLLYDGDDCKLVVPHLAEATADSERQGRGDIAIPSRSIVRLLDLAIPDQIAAV